MSPRDPVIPAVLAVVAVALFAVLLLAGTGPAAAGAAAVALLLVATALAVIGWRAARGREGRLGAVADALRKERADDRERFERHVRRLEESLSQERFVLRRLRDSWHAQREWSSELRRQLQQLHSRSSGRRDVLELVLDATIQLVNAEKGLLLAKADDNADGDLDLVTATGFSHDPEHSSVAQRFAREVLSQDQIVREDDPARPDGETSPADEEIDGLVAVPLFLHDRFHGVIVCANRPGGFADLDDEVLLALGNHAGAALQHGQLSRDLREAHRAPVRVLAEAASARDPLLHRESVALSVLASGLAGDLGLDENERDALVIATLLRAVGYLPLSDRLLLSRNPLTPDERALISLHPRLGFEILRQAPFLRDSATAVLFHHERYDGQGYPARLQGADIPLAARALSALEAYGAITHDRPHRAARGAEEACGELIEHAGTQFDPEVVQLLVERVRHAPARPSDELIDVILENLPLDRRDTDDAALDGLRASTVDGLTLLDDQRALQRAVREAASEATPAQRFAVVLLELRDLPRINEKLGYPAGDRLIQVAARRAVTAAIRLGATAYRASGRRLAIHVPLRDGDDLGDVLEDIRSEFMAGPAVEVVGSAWKPGDRGEDLLARARRALKGTPA
jgi:HD-GYP domain-containing protein (c-di-GMP phosphodiesterase class II)